MRNSNGFYSSPVYRTINGNKLKVVSEYTTTQSKRCVQTKQSWSPQQTEEYDEDDDTSDLDANLSESELEEIVEQKSVFKSVASTVRPLLQLFSEDTRPKPNSKPSAPVTPSKKSPVRKNKIVYKNIYLSSDEEFPKDDLDAVAISPVPIQPPQLQTSKRFNWTPKSTNLFLELWEKYLKGLQGRRNKSEIYMEMAFGMSEYGLTQQEIRCKMENMIKKHKVETEKLVSGNRTNWRYYKRVNALLYGTKSDFEKLFNKAERDSTDIESASSSMTDEEWVPETVKKVEKIEVDQEDETSPVVAEKPRQCDQTQSREEVNTTSDALLQIEREKLEVEKQKLQVMKHISRDLSAISKTLLEILRNTNK